METPGGAFGGGGNPLVSSPGGGYEVITMSQQMARTPAPGEPIVGGAAHRKSKVVNDPIHGHIRLDGLCLDIIDTPQFQRLRDLKQLGCTHMVFPGAVHSRFEHSLGVCHVANTFATRLYHSQGRELGIEANDVSAVTLAGLVHDLGHGPFSHVFDNEFLPAVGKKKFKHEQMSCDLLDLLVDENNVDIEADELRRVKELVLSSETKAPPSPELWGGKGFLAEIVANGRNSIDVDKFDYLQRDCYYCGVKASCDFSRLTQFAKVIDGEICWKATEVDNIYDMFHTRASLHRKIYTHRKAKAIEYMVVDALRLAEPVLKLSDKVGTAADFWQLDDTVLKQVETSSDPALAQARAVISRIRRRDLYRHVNEVCVPSHLLESWKSVEARDIVAHQDPHLSAVAPLTEDDIIVHNMSINYCQKDKDTKKAINPVDHVHFFATYDSDEKFTIEREKVSTLLPEVFEERRVRVYCRASRRDMDENLYEKKIQAVQSAFESLQRERNVSGQQVHGTPVKPRPRKVPRRDTGASGVAGDNLTNAAFLPR